jgi:hypothetical protein
VSLTQPAAKDCGLSFSMADVGKTFMLTLARLPAPMVSLGASSEHAQTTWLVCSQIYSLPIPSLLSPHASRWPPLSLYLRKQR